MVKQAHQPYSRKERTSKGRTMNPNYFVFCEGDTEVAYVEMLRQHYRLPIHIIPKKTLLNITPALVKRCEVAYVQTKNDQTFLMYDLDVPTILERLQKIPNTILLCSNPCFEFWLLLHYTDQKTELISLECFNRLSAFIRKYKKGTLDAPTKRHLMDNITIATERAKELQPYKNPSTTVYLLTDILEKLKPIEKRQMF